MSSICQITQNLSSLTSQIANHTIFSKIRSVEDLKIFMEQHVFAVWDFMCLLKELHRNIVITSAPWFPPKDALSANLISSILVDEEGDLTEDGVTYASHYDIYLSAMEKVGASTTAIKHLQFNLQKGMSVQSALDCLNLALSTKNFVLTTFSFFNSSVHELAAAFVYGREGITSPMFLPLIKQLAKNLNGMSDQSQLSTAIYYFNRHIELDNENHFPKALKMLSNLAGDDEEKLKAIEVAAQKALVARLEFLSGIEELLLTKNKMKKPRTPIYGKVAVNDLT